MHLSKPTECTTRQVNSNGNYGVMVMSQCRFMDFNKCTAVLWYMGSWGDCGRCRLGSIWEHCVLGTQFCHEPKTILQN